MCGPEAFWAVLGRIRESQVSDEQGEKPEKAEIEF